jgi:hypothetical protein
MCNFLKRYNLKFALDTLASNRVTIGSMIGNIPAMHILYFMELQRGICMRIIAVYNK